MATETQGRIETKRLLELAGISSQTLWNWVAMGLVPGYSGRELYGGRGSRYWYPPGTVELARKIKSWREQGIPYRQIRELLKSEGAEV
jgi:DNA-binding transcriptional MerR regulator